MGLGQQINYYQLDQRTVQRSNGSVIKLTASSMANSEFLKGIVEVKKNMVAFLRLVAQLGTKEAKWAWANKSTVINWIKNGATFQWISDKIDSIING